MLLIFKKSEINFSSTLDRMTDLISKQKYQKHRHGGEKASICSNRAEPYNCTKCSWTVIPRRWFTEASCFTLLQYNAAHCSTMSRVVKFYVIRVSFHFRQVVLYYCKDVIEKLLSITEHRIFNNPSLFLKHVKYNHMFFLQNGR